MNDRRFQWASLVVLGLIAASATAAGASSAPLLLTVHSEGSSFSGQPLLVELRIHRDGDLLSVSRNGAVASTPAQDETGVVHGRASGPALARFLTRMNRLRPGQLTGDCGAPMPDFFTAHTVTWYGRGGRARTVTFGATLQGCSEEVERLVQAVMEYWLAVRDEGGIVHSQVGVLSPFGVVPEPGD